MESQGSISLSPNGNGALFDALSKNGELLRTFTKELNYVQVVGVDNVLNKILDPTFIGYTFENKLKCSAKACAKVSP